MRPHAKVLFASAALALFLAFAGSAAAACPNEQLRTGSAAGLPNCRAYEMVSPVSKNGSDIWGLEGEATRVAADGERALFSSIGGFAGTGALLTMAQYLSERTPDGWVTRGISPPVDSTVNSPKLNVQGFTPNLDQIFFSKSDPALTPSAQAHTTNLYETDGHGNYKALTTAGPTDPGELFSYLPIFAAARPGSAATFFESTYPLAAGAVAGAPNLYETAGSGTHLVGVLPNGDPAPAGAVLGGQPKFLPSGAAATYTETAISPDGSRVFWTDLASGQVYVRLNGTVTKEVSASQRTNDTGPGGTDPLGPQLAQFRQASPDGRIAYFLSAEKLTNDSTANAENSKEDLYAYDIQSGELTDLTVAPDPSKPAGALGVLGTSDDGSRVYFAATGDLAGDAVEGMANIYLWQEGQISYIASVPNDAQESRKWVLNPIEGGGPKTSRLTSDGNVLLLTSEEQLTDYPTNGTDQVYLYNAAEKSLLCVSCNPRRTSSSSSGEIYVPGTSGALFNPWLKRVLSANGQRVYFETAEALVPGDVNGQFDVYQWEDGKVALISSGRGSGSSRLAEVSASGNDVFFVTRERLLPADIDTSVDVYDARVDGGFPAAATSSECSGEDCQPPGAAAPTAALPASASVITLGNRHRKRSRCVKRTRAKASARKRHAKARAGCRKAKRHAGKRFRQAQRHTRKRHAHGRGGSK